MNQKANEPPHRQPLYKTIFDSIHLRYENAGMGQIDMNDARHAQIRQVRKHLKIHQLRQQLKLRFEDFTPRVQFRDSDVKRLSKDSKVWVCFQL